MFGPVSGDLLIRRSLPAPEGGQQLRPGLGQHQHGPPGVLLRHGAGEVAGRDAVRDHAARHRRIDAEVTGDRSHRDLAAARHQVENRNPAEVLGRDRIRHVKQHAAA
jgi:hypothetical protein